MLEVVEIAAPSPSIGEVLIDVEYAGVNFIDVYLRRGEYPVANYPYVPGKEVVGTVVEVGAEVENIRPGDRIGSGFIACGGYAEQVCVPAASAINIPDGVDMVDACALLLQGLTAHYLAYSTFPLKSEHMILVHAAAGGVGTLLTQLAKCMGATVIGTVSTQEKADVALRNGVDHIVLYSEMDFEAEVDKLTDGNGVDVVYDSVGRMTFDKSLNSLKRRGCMVLYGQSSGAVSEFDLQELNRRGSLYITRPSLGDYISERSELEGRTEELFNLFQKEEIRLAPNNIFPLHDTAKAHDALESRKTVGKLLLGNR